MKKYTLIIKALAIAVFSLLTSCSALENIDAHDVDKAAEITKILISPVTPEK